MIRLKSSGDYAKVSKYLDELNGYSNKINLDQYGQKGVEALKSATPKDTGKTADSWNYSITHNKNNTYISWYNNNNNDGVNIAIILQYGHGTKNGGYVRGQDYINPSLKPIFDEIEESVVKELRRL